MGRLIAVIVLAIPFITAGYGIKLMRDSIFAIPAPWLPNMTLQFIVGFFLMVGCVGFFGGFLLRRDQRKGRVQERFRKEALERQKEEQASQQQAPEEKTPSI